MNTARDHDDDTTSDDNPDDLATDGLEANDTEAELVKELDDAAKDDAAKDEDGKDDDTDDDEDASSDGEDDGEDDDDVAKDDAASASAPAPAPAPAPSPAPVQALPTEPTAEKDFDAEFAKLEKQWDEGELEASEYNKQMRQLTREESQYTARVENWKSQIEQRQQAAELNFNAAAAAWEAENKDFMSNPIRKDAMQSAIASIDKETGGALTPNELLEKAAQATFEAFGYTPPGAAPAPAPTVDPAKAAKDKAKVKDAVQKRQDKSDHVPDLARAPAAAPVDAGSKGTYAQLDNANIDDLEDALAHMSQSDREAFLADSPGSDSRGE